MAIHQALTIETAGEGVPGFACAKFAAFLGLALAGCAGEPGSRGAPSFYRSLASAGAEVDAIAARDMISVYRRNNGLTPLALDPALQREAEARARAMAAAGAEGRDRDEAFKKRLASAGADKGARVENVSAGYHTLAEAFSGWRESRSHNANMLNPKVSRMGIATAFAPGGKYKVYWALLLSP